MCRTSSITSEIEATLRVGRYTNDMISSLELARLCGVSQATVDRAVHNRPGINPDTRARILRVAQQHGYRPNPVASELLRGDSNIVGAIVPALESVFFMDLMSAVSRSLAERGQKLFLTPVDNPNGFIEAIEEFAARRVKAVLVIPPADGLTIPLKLARTIRVISLISPCKGRSIAFVTPDESKTGRDATAYLTKLGHEHIAHVTYARKSHAIEARATGYEKEMRKRKLRPTVLRSLEDTALLGAVRKERITALFCHNDWQAVRAIRALQTHGLSVPGEVSVMGVDNTPTLRDVWPNLTTMTYPMSSLAAHIAAHINAEADLPAIDAFEVVAGETVRSLV